MSKQQLVMPGMPPLSKLPMELRVRLDNLELLLSQLVDGQQWTHQALVSIAAGLDLEHSLPEWVKPTEGPYAETFL